MDKIMDRFLEYVRIETTSDESSTSVPSSAGQLASGKHIADELKSMGLEKVNIDHNGYLTAVLPANTDADIPVIGFIAHMDTSPDISGKNVSPRVVEKYDGGDILLDPAEGIVLSPRDFPELSQLIGKTLLPLTAPLCLGQIIKLE